MKAPLPSSLEQESRDSLLATTRRLLVEMQAVSSRITAVQEIATAVNRTLNLNDILEVVRRQMKWVLDFDHFSVTLCAKEGEHQFIVLFGPATEPTDLHTAAGDPIGRAIATRQAQLLSQTDPTAHFRSQMILPLESEGEVLGTLNYATKHERRYTQDDLRVVYLLALQLAAAIRNAYRYQELHTLYAHLRQAEKLRDDMTHMIIHDLRNPLSVMLGTVDMFKSMHRHLSAEQSENLLDRAIAAGERMAGLISDVLTVGKIESGNLILVREPIPINYFFLQKQKIFQMQADLEGHQLSVEVGSQLVEVFLDHDLISRVLDNLVSNAFKYTSPGKEIRITAATTPTELHISVYNNGPTIPAHLHESIFDKYVQETDEKGANLRPGTGLGLAFCRMVVEAHGGRIWVEPDIVDGCTFTFSLPLNSDVP